MRIQQQSESLQQYRADIERFVRLAYSDAPEQFEHLLGVRSFIDGVSDFQLQQALRLECYKELEDALVYALEYAAVTVNRQ